MSLSGCEQVGGTTSGGVDKLTSSSKVQRGLNPLPWRSRDFGDILGGANGWRPEKRLHRSKFKFFFAVFACYGQRTKTDFKV